jgi:hypothetical protein
MISAGTEENLLGVPWTSCGVSLFGTCRHITVAGNRQKLRQSTWKVPGCPSVSVSHLDVLVEYVTRVPSHFWSPSGPRTCDIAGMTQNVLPQLYAVPRELYSTLRQAHTKFWYWFALVCVNTSSVLRCWPRRNGMCVESNKVPHRRHYQVPTVPLPFRRELVPFRSLVSRLSLSSFPCRQQRCQVDLIAFQWLPRPFRKLADQQTGASFCWRVCAHVSRSSFN